MRTLTFQAVLGAGAFGTVYRAVLDAPGGFAHVVAAKVLREGVDGEAQRRVRDEARLLGRLVDPRIAGAREIVTVDGRDTVLLPLVEGVDLSAALAEGPLPPRAVAELGVELAGALATAHEARDPVTGQPMGVVHRDVKPANVRVSDHGAVTLLDFGVAHARFASRESRTGSQEVLGSPAWMAPEYLRDGVLGPAVDMYALGVVLLEAATGRRLGKPRGDAQAHQARVDALCGELGAAAALAPALRELVAREPGERPSARRLVGFLLTLADGLPGQGLRAWAAVTVPRVRVRGETGEDALGLLGRVVTIEEPSLPETPTVEPAPTAEPRMPESLDLAAPTVFVPVPRPATAAAVAPPSQGLTRWPLVAGVALLVVAVVLALLRSRS